MVKVTEGSRVTAVLARDENDVTKELAKKVRKTSTTRATEKETTAKRTTVAKTTLKKTVKPALEAEKKASYERRLLNEVKRLRKINKDIPESQRVPTSKLLHRAAYISAKLEETEEKINEAGVIEEFKNGAQKIPRINTHLKVYIQLLQVYTKLMQQIEDMIRHDSAKAKKDDEETADTLEKFINSR